MSELAHFQSAFALALRFDAPLEEPAVAALAAQPAFAIYRNGVMKHATDALAANFPAVLRLVGEAWFRAAACEFVRAYPPARPMLVDYGAAFPDFLAGFAPAADLPYLVAVARLDRLWTECHVAADAKPLDVSTLGGLEGEALAAARLVPHPAARWLWSEREPACTLWERNRTTAAFDPDIDWSGEGALLVRPGSEVIWMRIDRAACAFLDACRASETLDRAAAAALASDPEADLGTLLQTLLLAGAFGAAHPRPSPAGEIS